ncbi:MAG: IS1634 family transposase, partial [Coriobacteriales bacterium]|nr:IS1634 family transposase [Coriobacteriales bacterium]
EHFSLSKDDIYAALSFVASEKDAILAKLDGHMRRRYNRCGGTSYYDVTNYYFEIDAEDELRRRGVSKEHRPDPIVQMGLLIDAEGFPITYNLHPGNTHDAATLISDLVRIKRDFSDKRIVVVGDKGINCSDNIFVLLAKGDGYVFSSSVRGGTEELKAWATSLEGFSEYKTQEEGFKCKSRIATRKIKVTTEEANKALKRKRKTKTTEITERQVAFYSPKYARRAKCERERAILKARKMMENPSRLEAMFDKSAARYVKGIVYDEAGEILEAKTALFFDEERLAEEEALDGYYVISTSEFEATDSWVIDTYRGLWRIEETFRVEKSLLSARPVYLSRAERIEAHFLICFIALLVMRILEHRTKHAHTMNALIKTLRAANGTHLGDNWWIFDHRDAALDAIGDVLGIDLTRQVLSEGDVREMSGAVKRASRPAG